MANKSKSIYYIILFIFCCLWASHAGAADVLNQGDVLNSSLSLVSSNGNFTLRFHNLNSTKDSISYYLGIWYQGDTVTSHQPFWIANRDRPVTDDSGALVIDETGKLIITYNGGAPLELYSGQSNTRVTAVLQDNGNFVLKEANNGGVTDRILWQSFDSPTDSFLPGMKLGINHKTGQNWSLTSWLTDSIPAPGAFSLDWDPDEHQLILRRRGVTFWTSGVLLENNTFENVLLYGQEADHKFIEVSNEDGKYLTYEFVRNQYTPENWINVTWLLLSYDGDMMDQSSSLAVLDSDWCDGYDISSGCKRWEGPKCRSHGESFRQERGYFPGSVDTLFDDNTSLSLGDCKDICWKNCTCVGTATSLNPNGTGCTFWYGPLEASRIGVSESLYYIIRPGPPGSKLWIWILIAVAATLVAILLGILVFLRRRRLRQQEKFLHDLMTLDNPSEARELEVDGNKGHNLTVYTVSSIMDATKSFSIENKLGEGGFGPVYKGKLPDGREIAIKRLSRRSGQGLLEFKNELILIAKLQHTNLVQLLGFCIHGEEKMLVYEYMPNKSLDSYIFDQSKRELLDWKKCCNIIEGIAQGLLYLHKYSRLRIIHRDLKVSNILLDENMNPKISDFGMARIFTTQSEANTNRIVGTYGYMSPEYAMEGIFSEKSDIFSFGVLVLEIISGRKNNSFFHADQPLNLIGYAWRLWKEGDPLEVAHPSLRSSSSKEQVLRCINVALLCVEDNPSDRPSVSIVISMLTSEAVELPMPKQPAYSAGRKILEDNLISESMTQSQSRNHLTISVMDTR
ncbi:hypothetical protein ACOSQ3_014705 [Xanthoceras sorbifolium]